MKLFSAFCWLLAMLTLFSVAGCGQTDRALAYATGNAQESCVDGVLYLQFTSGASVKYLPDGKIATCSKK